MTEEQKQILLELIAYFDDYSHPILMEAEYVREEILEFIDIYK